MIEPDRGKISLDLGDDGPPLVLWYTPGAIRMVCKAIGVDVARMVNGVAVQAVTLQSVHSLLLDHLKPDTIATFVWAGRLWEERKLKPDAIAERIDWSPVPLLELTRTVSEAVYLGLTGKSLGESGGDAEPTDPEKPAAVNGAGKMPSASPSAKPVIQ
jgi:hypothetical protein